MKARAVLMAMLVWAGATACSQSGPGEAPSVEQPWARATPPGAQVGAVYFDVVGGSVADRLLGGTTPVAQRVELHEMHMEGDIMRMRAVREIEIPRSGRIELKPGGLHVMLIGIRQPLTEGERFPMTLRFEHAGTIDLDVLIRAPGARAPGPGHGHH